MNLFDDVTAIYTSSYITDTKRLQESAVRIIKYLTKWKIKVNRDKIEAIIITKRRPTINKNIKLDGYPQASSI